ncbi:SAF domain-containing protein [Cellulomonas sp. ATA003]|uniref:SAF domain-containing protein n=1 Tax=Cellulomonas sp. ATA003 TaxID=3073064 RepID=UPI002873F30F|nr:SAF domain-containing protein [Cellulomonas sp. ATA003]WNB85155.1 SAF domain-containing protein [Cellulomonas sp. ATA003]
MGKPTLANTPRRSPMRASTLIGIGVLALTAMGIVYLRANGTESVWVVTRDVPAYHQVRQLDLSMEDVPRTSVPNDALTDEDAILGKYTVQSMSRGDPITRGALGPAQIGAVVDGLSLVALPATLPQVLNGELRRGDTIELLFASRIDGQAVSIPGVSVIDVRRAERAYTLTVGLSDDQLADFRTADWQDWSAVRSEPYASP